MLAWQQEVQLVPPLESFDQLKERSSHDSHHSNDPSIPPSTHGLQKDRLQVDPLSNSSPPTLSRRRSPLPIPVFKEEELHQLQQSTMMPTASPITSVCRSPSDPRSPNQFGIFNEPAKFTGQPFPEMISEVPPPSSSFPIEEEAAVARPSRALTMARLLARAAVDEHDTPDKVEIPDRSDQDKPRVLPLPYSTPVGVRSIRSPTKVGGEYELSRARGGPGPRNNDESALNRHEEEEEELFTLTQPSLPTDFLTAELADHLAARSAALQSETIRQPYQSHTLSNFHRQVFEKPEAYQQITIKNAAFTRLLQTEGGSHIILNHLRQGGTFMKHFTHTHLNTAATNPSTTTTTTSSSLQSQQLNAHRRQVWVSSDLKFVFWGHSKQHATGSMDMDQIVVIFSGAQTRIFKDRLSTTTPPLATNHCFSLITSSRTLDLECQNELERDLWMLSFQFLLDHVHSRRGGRMTSDSSTSSQPSSLLIPSNLTLAAALELVSSQEERPPVLSNTASSSPQFGSSSGPASSDESVRSHSSFSVTSKSTTSSPSQTVHHTLRPSSSTTQLSTGSSQPSSLASSVTSTPAFGSPWTSPQQVSRNLFVTSPSPMLPLANSKAFQVDIHAVGSNTAAESVNERRRSMNAISTMPALQEQENESASSSSRPMNDSLTDATALADASTLTLNLDEIHLEDNLLVPPLIPVNHSTTPPQPRRSMSMTQILTPNLFQPNHPQPAPDQQPQRMSTTSTTIISNPPDLSHSLPPPNVASSVIEPLAPGPQASPPESQSTTPHLDPMMATAPPPLKPSPLTLQPRKLVPTLTLPPPAMALPPPANTRVPVQTHPSSTTTTGPSAASTYELNRIRAWIKRERADHQHLRHWVAHRFLHLQSHINSLMIEQHKLLQQQRDQEKEEELAVEREIKRISGAQVGLIHELSLQQADLRRCYSSTNA